VDILDINSSNPFFNDHQFIFISPLDLFRYSAASAALGVIDWTADNRPKYFSIDGGATSIARFAEGVVWGDGRQASHWKDSMGIGIMDPTAAQGETLSISQNDLRALDVIGWDVVVVPEPGTVALCGLAFVGVAIFRRRRLG
jgi:hypothetical protein